MALSQQETTSSRHRQTVFVLLLLTVVSVFARGQGAGQEVAGRPEVYAQLGHTRGIRKLAVTPDGRRVISLSPDNRVKVWDTESGRLVQTCEPWALKDGNLLENWVAVTPDSKRMVVAGIVWDIESGRRLQPLQEKLWIRAAAVTSDGRRVVGVAGVEGTVKVWDIETGKWLRTLHGFAQLVDWLVITPDNRFAVSGGSDHKIMVWDLQGGSLLRTLEGHKDDVTSVAITPDSRQIISGSKDATIKIWNLESGVLSQTLEGHTLDVTSVAVTPDGRKIVSGSLDNTIRIWDIESGKLLQTSQESTRPIWAVAVTPDGKRVISGDDNNPAENFPGNFIIDTSSKESYGAIIVWDIESLKMLRMLQGQSARAINAMGLSPDGTNAVAVGDDHRLRVWDLEAGKLLHTSQEQVGTVRSLAFTLRGRRLLTTVDGEIRLWDIDSGKLLRTLKAHTESVHSAAITTDGRRIASVGNDSTRGELAVKVWDIESGSLLRTLTTSARPLGVVATSGSKIMVFKYAKANSQRLTIEIYDGENGTLLRTLKGYEAWNTNPVISPDGRYVILTEESIGGGVKKIRVWDVEQEKMLRTFSSYSFSGATFTPDGRSVLAADASDRTIKVWDVKSGKLSHTLKIAQLNIETIAMTPDNKRLIVSGADGALEVHDLFSGREISRLIGFADGEWLSLTPEGYYNASPQGDQYLNVRVGNRVYAIDQFRSTFYRPQVVEAALRLNSSSAAVTSTVGSNAPKLVDALSFEPPSIIVNSPADGQRVSGQQVELSFVVEDRNHPLKSVQVFVNQNRTATTRTRGWGAGYEESVINLTEGQRRLDLKRTLQLQPGENVIKVVAANAFAETPFTIRVTTAATEVASANGTRMPQLWILSIGVNNTPQLRGRLERLDYAASDSEAFVKKFKQQEGRLFSKVNALIINDDPSKGIENLAKNRNAGSQEIRKIYSPTFENIADNLKYLRKAQKGDYVILFIAGHAVSDNGAYYFMPNDAALDEDGGVKRSRAVSWTDIRDALYLVDVTVWAFLDTCHAGGALGRIKTADTNYLIKELQDSAIVFASSTGDQDSQENSKWGHGAFTYALLKGLDGEAESLRDGIVMMSELKSYVIELVAKETNEKQTPVLYPKDFRDMAIFRLGK